MHVGGSGDFRDIFCPPLGVAPIYTHPQLPQKSEKISVCIYKISCQHLFIIKYTSPRITSILHENYEIIATVPHSEVANTEALSWRLQYKYYIHSIFKSNSQLWRMIKITSNLSTDICTRKQTHFITWIV